jgi:multiple sugar transport system ATP-binding protein
MAKIELKNVHKSYGAVDVIKGIDLTIEKGEFMVFVGPSGCGKSTLLRLISGLEQITEGDMLFDGERVNNVIPFKRGIAMVFQSYALYPHMNVYDNMAFGLKLANTSADELDKRVKDAARLLQIDHLLDRLPKQLSGGQRQRVAIGRAIVRDPRVFLFDEPLSNLDAALRVQTRLEIAKLHHSTDQVTMIYVTHDQVEAMTLADRIAVLRDGKLMQVGTPAELYERPNSIFVAGFTTGTPWIEVNPNHATINAEADQPRRDGVFAIYKRLAALRKAEPIVVHGVYTPWLEDHPQIVAYTRTLADQRLIVLANFTGQPVSTDLPAALNIAGRNLIATHYARSALQHAVTLAPYEAFAILGPTAPV